MKFTFFVIAAFTSLGLHAEPLSRAVPEDVGVSTERLGMINAYARREIEAGRLAGVVTMVARHGKIVHHDAVGKYGMDNDKPMDTDALFRIYSMTKPITTVAAMMLYEEGAFQLDDPVSKYIPELAGQKVIRDGVLVDAASEMTIVQLMTHTAGLTYGGIDEHPVEKAYAEAKLFESADLDEFVQKLGTIPLRFEPGTRYHYSVATDVLGVVVERLSGLSLDVFFAQRIFAPLGMRDTFFNVPEDKLDRLVSNHYWDREQGAMVLMSGDSGRPPTGVTLFSGGGGLISTAMDYMIFCEMLRKGGSYAGIRILGSKTIQYMTLNHLSDAVRNEAADEYPAYHLYPGQGFGLGFGVITEPQHVPVISSLGAYSWGGAANTKFWIDPEEGLVAIFMSQIMGSPWSDPTRFNMKIATYQALTELGSD